MRMPSREARYALRILYSLTRFYGRGPSAIATILEGERIPVELFDEVFERLVAGGIVERGADVCRLARPPEYVSVGEVIRIVDGEAGDCLGSGTGETNLILAKARDAASGVLYGTTLAEVLQRMAAKESPHTLSDK